MKCTVRNYIDLDWFIMIEEFVCFNNCHTYLES